VLIVGGGPAGLEAARVAALRGHRVTLYERMRNSAARFGWRPRRRAGNGWRWRWTGWNDKSASWTWPFTPALK
jgi:flavin-dependent dehydrogenase